MIYSFFQCECTEGGATYSELSKLYICLQRKHLQPGTRLPEIYWNLNIRQRPGAGNSEERGTRSPSCHSLETLLYVCCHLSCVRIYLPSMSPQIALLRGENAMAKTLQSAVETLQRDKAQLQSRVKDLEQRLVGTPASEGEDRELPPSGEQTMIRAHTHSHTSSCLICFLLLRQAMKLWSS